MLPRLSNALSKFLAPIISTSKKGSGGGASTDSNPGGSKQKDKGKSNPESVRSESTSKEALPENASASQGLVTILGEQKQAKEDQNQKSGLDAYREMTDRQGRVRLRRGVMMDKKAE